MTMAHKGKNNDNEPPAWAVKMQNDLKIMMEETTAKQTATLEKSIKQVEGRITCVEERNAVHDEMIGYLRDEHDNLADRVAKLECQSMNNNILLSGISEQDKENETNLKAALMTLFQDELELDYTDITITSCYRLRKQMINSSHGGKEPPRNVVAKLVSKSEVDVVLKAAKKLKGRQEPIYINPQFPSDIAKKRRILQPVLYRAREQQLKATMNLDKLNIEGVQYSVENVFDVPFNISSLHTKENANSVVFHGRFSPFSNFHPSNFYVDGEKFYCVEQYYQLQKARAAKSDRSAIEILMTKDPAKMKRIGDSLNPNKWQPSTHMMVALKAQFSQNQQLLDMLRKTDTKKLAEASFDKYWGTGIDIKNKDVLKSTGWKGKNTLGKMLETIRTEMKNN
jgi:ribA/ribD-fused uncharacterized protein